MNIANLLQMAAAADPERAALGPVAGPVTYGHLARMAESGAALLRERRAAEVVYLGPNSVAFAVAFFAAAWAGVPLVPVNYRLGVDQRSDVLDNHPDALVITDEDVDHPSTMSTTRWVEATSETRTCICSDDPDSVAVVLYTSGTTAKPKAALLRHRHLSSYVLSAVDFASADPTDAALVSVPPYHIAGVSNLLSNVFSGRRVVYLDAFTAADWLACVREQRITHALVVPTMLSRITEHLRDSPSAAVPTLRSLAYGGSKMPAPVLRRALQLFVGTDFVNAYGLTETSSTIAVLGPDEHRAAVGGDTTALRRLTSVGRLLPGVEVQVLDGEQVLAAGETGDVYVRGPQVAGEYRGSGSALDADGWFATRDRGSVDTDGYLYIEGRSDDTIIRGGENIAPAEIEDVLLEHDEVTDVAVVGVPDEQWGQVLAAMVVLREGSVVSADDIAGFARSRLRSSKTPTVIVFRDDLPQTPTGKTIRRAVLADLMSHELAPAALQSAVR